MSFRTFTLTDLCLSPLNVRTNAEDAEATEALEASILARGLLFPLVVHPFASFPKLKRLPGEPPHQFGTLAGGRRLRAIRKLAGDGRIPADWPIDGVIRDVDPAQITELSLAENLLRRELRPYEIHAAIAKAAGQGATLDQIAANIGQRREWVARQMRLGSLAPEIFAAYVAGKLDADQAQAYAATADQALQRAAFTHFGGAAKAAWVNQHEVRRWLKVGDFELARLLRFVGLDAYRAAGGRFELDLFYDGAEERGRVLDEGTLRELAERRLEELREDLRAELECPGLRFLAAKPNLALYYEPGSGPLPDAVAAHLEIEAQGTAQASYWWESKKARAAAERAGGPSQTAPRPTLPAGHPARVHDSSGFDALNNYVGAQAARAAVKDEHGLTAEGLHVMRSLRREILRAALCADAFERRHDRDEGVGVGTLGRDYLVWSQLRQELGAPSAPWLATATGARGLGGTNFGSDDAEPREFVAPFIAETRAHRVWQAGLEMLRGEAFMNEPDPAASLKLYVGYDESLKNQFAAILAGSQLLRSANVAGWRIPAHDALADLLGLDAPTIRKAWSPTPAFMALFPRLKRLEHARPFIDPKTLAEWAKKDDKTITGATAAALDPGSHSDPAIARAAGEWVHELLQFRLTHDPADPNPPAPAQAGVDAPADALEPAL